MVKFSTYLMSAFDGEKVSAFDQIIPLQLGQIYCTGQPGEPQAYKVKDIEWLFEEGVLSQDVMVDPVDWNTKEKVERSTPEWIEFEDKKRTTAMETIKDIFNTLEENQIITVKTKGEAFKLLEYLK